MVTGLRTRAVPASEILIYPELVFNRVIAPPVAFSRSGTTTETLRAVRKAKAELKLPVLPISCDMASPLSREGDFRLTFPFPAERSVVMTGSFTTMLMAILYLDLQSGDHAARLDMPENIPGSCEELMGSTNPGCGDRGPAVRRICLPGRGPTWFGQRGRPEDEEWHSSHGFHALESATARCRVTDNHDRHGCFPEPGRQLELQRCADMQEVGAECPLPPRRPQRYEPATSITSRSAARR